MPTRAHDFLPLHPLDLRVLMALMDGASYGTRIVEEIEARERGARIYPANLFRRIRRLLDDGLLQEARAPEGADSRRTYVELTRLGRAVARADARRLRELVDEATARRLLPES